MELKHRVFEAPPLTTDTLLPLLTEVKSWQNLAKGLIHTHDNDSFVRFSRSVDLDTLQRQHSSGEECLKSVIEKFLQGKGGRYKQPSWRAVIWSLYKANEIQLASHLKSYGEPLQEPTLTVGNVTRVMGKTTMDKRRGVWEMVLDRSVIEEIYSWHSSEEEELHSCADTYVTCKPDSSWEELVHVLYDYREMAAAKEAKAFLQQNDPTLIVGNVTRVMEKITMDKRRGVWERVLGEDAVRVIYSSHSSEEEKLHSCADTYATCKPDSSWEHLVQRLYNYCEMSAAKEAKAFLQQNDPTLIAGNVTRVMEKTTVDQRREVWEEMLGRDAVEEIYSSHSSEEEKLYSCADTYVTCKPDSSWEELVQVLYDCGERAAAKEAKAFLQQNDPTLTVGNITRVMEKITMDKRREVWERVLSGRAIEEIYSSHSSEEEKLHSCADTYVTCKPDSSWEELVRWLYACSEMAATKEAKAFLQQKDPTLTINNVTDVMEKVTMDKRRRVWGRVLGRGGESHVDEIYSSHSSEKEKTHACSDIYVNCYSESSWEHLTSLLYEEDETTAVDQARPFLPPRDLTLTTDRLTELFQSVEDPDTLGVYGIGELLGLPQSVLEEIRRSYQSKTKRKDAYLDTYTHRHPCPSWKKISEVLMECDLDQQADEVKNTYVQVSERTQHNFDIAMQGGYAMIRNGSVFFLGSGGSGKTHTLHSLLEEDPPPIRQSTPCAKRAVRTIAQCKVGVKDIHFVRIKDDQYSDMLSTTAKQLPLQQPSISTTTPPPAQPRPGPQETSEETNSASSPASSVDTQETDSKRVASASSPDKKKHPSHRSGFEKELLRRMQLVPKRSENLIDKDLIDMKDSRGQPMFHEVLPLFVKNTTFGVLTVKLNERLDSYPMVDYYSNGKPVGKPFPSPFTHLQTYRHCMRVLQSTCSRDTCPKLVFIGTHKDHEQECSDEKREEKNRKLRSIIPPDLKKSILYYEHSNEDLLFCVNVKTPENEDRKMIEYVRQMMINELQKLPQQKIPLQYFALENAFLRLAKYQRKAILSKEECFIEAVAYHFTKESFEAALKYLHGLKLIFYYEEVLPEVVFVDAQTILDKITELVEFSLSLVSKPVHELTVSMDINEFEEFKAYGIVTLKLLSQFSSHYVPGLFMQQQLVVLLKYLRVIAEVSKGKFLVPCLLKVTAILCPLPHSTSIPALLFYFGPNGPKLGVYCCLLASLITEAKWELMTENDRPVQVSRNQVQFRLPGNDPGAITITDTFSTSFHVSIDFPEDMDTAKAIQISKKVCPTVRETILTGIRKASQKLNYNNSIPEVAFPCSKHLPSALHPATVSDSELLTCTTHPGSVYNDLTEQHQIWLGKEVQANAGVSSQSHQDTVSVSPSLASRSRLGIERYKFLQQALNSGLQVPLKYLKFVFLGAPGAGKTTFMRRLKGEIIKVDPDEVQPSTLAADQTNALIKVCLDEDSSHSETTIITKSQWCSVKTEDGEISDLDNEALLIYRFIVDERINAQPSGNSQQMLQETIIMEQPTTMDIQPVLEENREKEEENESDFPAHSHDPTLSRLTLSNYHNVNESSQMALESNKLETIEELKIVPCNPSADGHTSSNSNYNLLDRFKDMFEAWKNLLIHQKYDQIEKMLSQSILVNMIDVAGQPPFLEMIPAFALGPGLYLICFDLQQNEFDKRYDVQYITKDCKPHPLPYSYTVSEVLFQCISSIACFSAKSDDSRPLPVPPPSQTVMIIGTHKDKVKDEDIKSLDDTIQSELDKLLTCDRVDEKYYHKYLYKNDGKILVAVDNTLEEDEVQSHRKLIEQVISEKFYTASKYPIPASWLMFSIFLRKINRNILSIQECQQLAKELGIKEDDVKHILWFFHHYIGILMYYTEDEVKGIEEDIIICRPQILFTSIGQMILDKFLCERCGDDRIRENFWKKGQFTQEDVEKNTASSDVDDDRLSTKQLVCILKYLNVLVLLKPKVFFMPAVLKSASSDVLDEHKHRYIIAPLIIRFESVFVPVGCFTTMIAQLVCDQTKNHWQLSMKDDLYKDMVTFKLHGNFKAILISRPKQYEVHLLPIPNKDYCLSVECIASDALKTVCGALNTVLKRLRDQYSSPNLTIYRLGFFCCCKGIPNDDGRHLMLVDTTSGNENLALCIEDMSDVTLKPAHLVWINHSHKFGIPDVQPGDLKVTHKLPTSVTVTWTPIPVEEQNGVITGYTMQVMGPDHSAVFERVVSADATSIDIPNLNPFTLYTFKVSAKTKADSGPEASKQFKTPEGAPSGSPGELTVDHRLPTTAKLSWTPLSKEKQNGVITGYTVHIVGPDHDSKQEISADGTSVEISELSPFMKYTFNISAKTKAGFGPTASKQFKTPEGAPSGEPGGLTVNYRLPTTTTLSWTPVPEEERNGVSTGYTVQVVGPDHSTVFERVVSADATSIDIPNLNPFTLYTFKVSTKTEAGSGPAASTSSRRCRCTSTPVLFTASFMAVILSLAITAIFYYLTYGETHSLHNECSLLEFVSLTKIKDFHVLRQSVTEIGDWHSLCTNLEVNIGIMNRLKNERFTEFQKKDGCLQSYVDSDEASWEEVVIAVARHPFNNKRLAKNIAEKHLHSPNNHTIISMVDKCMQDL